MSSFIPKQYGLILKKPAANGPNAAKKPAVKSVFADDDDDDGNVAGQSVMAKVRVCVCVVRRLLECPGMFLEWFGAGGCNWSKNALPLSHCSRAAFTNHDRLAPMSTSS
jgi:hypothetical protein